MAFLGFDALGRWALGELPANNNAALSAAVGALALGGQSIAFKVTEPGNASSFNFAGIGSSFKVGGGSSVGTLAVASAATSFSMSEAAAAGSIVLTGIASSNLVAASGNPAAFALTGVTAIFSIGLAPSLASLQLASAAATFNRDFVNWFRQPLAGEDWSAEITPLPEWSAANSPAVCSWSEESVPSPAWAPLLPPSNVWTVDPVQQILPPVTE